MRYLKKQGSETKYVDLKNNKGCLTSIVGGVVLALSLGCCTSANSWHYSSGERVGVINKLSRKGMIWETYEGQMALEGLVGGQHNTTAANVWNFSIDETAANGENVEELSEQLRDAMISGDKVKVTYKEVLSGWPWRGRTDHYIQSVKPLKNIGK